ncbi:MAG: hypothetical protein IJT70_05400 [Clostridia bacterium]|nr:hypothetical protein [Clostridia bacterium]
MGWEEAEEFCESKGGHLVTITSAAEAAALSPLLLSATSSLWIGATDAESEGVWKWVTGEEFWNNGTELLYCNWLSGEPNNSANEDFGVMDLNGGWNDTNKTNLYGFILEKDRDTQLINYVAATCTEPGYSGDRVIIETGAVVEYGEVLPARGHNMIATSTIAGCEYYTISYDCSRCDYTYTETVDTISSEWMDTKPSGIDDSLLETKTEYRSANKETTTCSSNSMSGWILYDSSYVWSNWGSWSGWSSNYVAPNDYTQVSTRTAYHYYYYVCSNCGAHMHGYGTCYTWAGGCGSQNTVGTYHAVRCDVPYSSTTDFYGTGVYYTDNTGEGRGFAYINSSSSYYEAPITQYRYRTRTQIWTYYFYRWGEWSEWQDEPITASENVQVDTRTLYRYDVGTLGHDYQITDIIAPTCTEDGYTVYTCTRCGDSYNDDVIPAEGHVYGDWSVVTVATCYTDGLEHRLCTYCGDEDTRVIEATGNHIYDPNTGICTTSGCGAIDPNFNPEPIDPNGPKAIVEDKIVKPGDEVTVNVSLENTPAIKSIAVSDVSFNTSVLEMLGAEWSLNNPILSSWDANTGKGVATLSSAQDLNGNTVFTLTFSVSGNAEDGVYTLSLKVSAKDASNANVTIYTEAGSITVRNVLPGDFNGDDEVTDEDAIYLLFYTFFPEDYPLN